MKELFESAETLFNEYGEVLFTPFFIWFGTCITLDLLSFGVFKAFGLLNIGKKS